MLCNLISVISTEFGVYLPAYTKLIFITYVNMY